MLFHRDRVPEIHEGQHPALIEMDLFKRVQDMRALLSRNPRESHGREAQIFPLTGVLRCGYCGTHFRGVSVRGTRYYRDVAQIEHLKDCSQPIVRADQIEQQIVDYLLTMLKPAVDAQELATTQSSLAAAEARFDRAQALYLAGEITRTDYETERVRLAKRKPYQSNKKG